MFNPGMIKVIVQSFSNPEVLGNIVDPGVSYVMRKPVYAMCENQRLCEYYLVENPEDRFSRDVAHMAHMALHLKFHPKDYRARISNLRLLNCKASSQLLLLEFQCVKTASGSLNIPNEARHKKTCLWDLRQGKAQMSLLSCRD